jgi:hypothetical protein
VFPFEAARRPALLVLPLILDEEDRETDSEGACCLAAPHAMPGEVRSDVSAGIALSGRLSKPQSSRAAPAIFDIAC